MNYWTQLSIKYASERSYLDDLFRIYPTIPEGIRDINKEIWRNVETAFQNQENENLIRELLKLDLFPIKDSYISYLRRDKTAIKYNPKTINRLCGRIYEMGLDNLYKECSQPKETNRQIGPMFRRWLQSRALGIKPVDINTFLNTNDNAILDGSDAELKKFAKRELGYDRDKGLDFVGRFNGKYVISEAKFITDFGGNQNAQFNDAVTLFQLRNLNAIPIAIIDGVPYIKSNNKMYKQITEEYREKNIMSALVLRDFLYQL
jgi:hypothetical protein